MKNFNASFLAAINEVESSGIVNLFEVQVTASPVVGYQYYSGYNATINYFIPETTTPQTYSPAPIVMDDIELDDGSKIPSVALIVGGADQVILAYMENEKGMKGYRVRRLEVPIDYLANASAYNLDVFYIDGATTDSEQEVVYFELTTKGAIAGVTVPQRVMRRDHCYKRYNASDCRASSVQGEWLSAFSDRVCKKIKTDCASKDNVINFGGFPGIGTKRVFF